MLREVGRFVVVVVVVLVIRDLGLPEALAGVKLRVERVGARMLELLWCEPDM